MVRIGVNRKFKRAGASYFTFLLEKMEVELRLEDILDCLRDALLFLGFYLSHFRLSRRRKNPLESVC